MKDDELMDSVYTDLRRSAQPAGESSAHLPGTPVGPTTALPRHSRPSDVGAVKDKLRPATVASLADALRQPLIYGVRVGEDRFLNRVMIEDPASGVSKWRPITDADYTRIREHLERAHGFSRITKDTIRDVVDMVAEEKSFDSAQQWLDCLTWDGTPRVETFLTRYMGAADTKYTRAVSRYIWTAAVGRVLVPGIKADMVPVAVGRQGARKSSAIAALVPDPQFVGEIDLARRDDDTSRILQGKLVVELPELKGLRGRDVESVKAFIARPDDEWVEKYMVHAKKRLRRCIFFGSTNESEFLVDSSGERRWLPFNVSQCDPDGIVHDRDQLWAEARVRWAIDGCVDFMDAEVLARREHHRFKATDPWQELIESYTNHPPARFDELDAADGQSASWPPPSRTPGAPLAFVTSAELMERALKLKPVQMLKCTEQRIGRLLHELGWSKKQKRFKGVPKPVNGWERSL